jgi:hypothetical protein
MKVREVISFKKYFESFLLEQPKKVQDKIFKIIEAIETLEKIPNQILAYHNGDLIGAGDGRDYGVEIYQSEDGDYLEALDYEFFHTESEALARVNQINGAFIDDIEDL